MFTVFATMLTCDTDFYMVCAAHNACIHFSLIFTCAMIVWAKCVCTCLFMLHSLAYKHNKHTQNPFINKHKKQSHTFPLTRTCTYRIFFQYICSRHKLMCVMKSMTRRILIAFVKPSARRLNTCIKYPDHTSFCCP